MERLEEFLNPAVNGLQKFKKPHEVLIYAEQLTCSVHSPGCLACQVSWERQDLWAAGRMSAGCAEITLHFHVGLSIAATRSMAGPLRDVSAML